MNNELQDRWNQLADSMTNNQTRFGMRLMRASAKVRMNLDGHADRNLTVGHVANGFHVCHWTNWFGGNDGDESRDVGDFVVFW